LLDWESLHGQIPMQAAVIFNFGWSSKFSDPVLYRGSESEDQFTYVFPAVGAEAGMWLYENRDIKIIATDTMTPDPLSINGSKITSFPIHQKYLPNGQRLPPKGFRFHAAPVKYVGGTGTQVRAHAMTFDDDFNAGMPGLHTAQNFYCVLLLISCSLYLGGFFVN
ncbi:unnamed protein product, partial [Candidula unifasciata]